MTAATPTEGTTDGPQHSRARRRRRWIGVAVLVAIVVLAVVLLWFQPQVLLYDTVVEDDFPAAAPPAAAAGADGDEPAPEPDPPAPAGDAPASDEAGTPDEPPPTGDRDETDAGDASRAAASEDASAAEDPARSDEEPVALLTGSFASRNRYTVTGSVTAYELPDATRILRLEGFESTNGPDLFVYLTVGDASEPSDGALAAEYVDLGVLRGNVGDQNYAIPSDVDLARFDTVVIWCRRFSTAFGAADLR